MTAACWPVPRSRMGPRRPLLGLQLSTQGHHRGDRASASGRPEQPIELVAIADRAARLGHTAGRRIAGQVARPAGFRAVPAAAGSLELSSADGQTRLEVITPPIVRRRGPARFLDLSARAITSRPQRQPHPPRRAPFAWRPSGSGGWLARPWLGRCGSCSPLRECEGAGRAGPPLLVLVDLVAGTGFEPVTSGL